MIKSIIAYNLAELEKREIVSAASDLYKSKILDEEQWNKIRSEYVSKLYSPSLFMKILLFIVSLIGLSTLIGPIGLIFDSIGEIGYRFLSLILGFLLIIFTEKIFIKKGHHYKSGVTEAGIYTGLSFIAFGILGFNEDNELGYAIVGFLFAGFVAVRYLDLPGLILTMFFLGWILFLIITGIGGIVEALMPFIFMTTFGLIYWFSKKLQAKLPNVIFDSQFVILKSCALIVFYCAGNYFVVRELSIELMGLTLAEHDDIHFAFLFYLFTALIPVGYIYFGVKKRSILLIRVGLLTFALGVATFKYYFSLGHPMLTITVSGGVLIAIALLLLNYLKVIRNGYTREQLLQDKWSSKDLTAIIASQTLGGHAINNPIRNDELFKGGSFGGAGAGGDW